MCKPDPGTLPEGQVYLSMVSGSGLIQVRNQDTGALIYSSDKARSANLWSLVSQMNLHCVVTAPEDKEQTPGEIVLEYRYVNGAFQCADRVKVTVVDVNLTNGANQVRKGKYVYISQAPAMPDLSVGLLPSGLPGTVQWQLDVRYERVDRGDASLGDIEYYPGPGSSDWQSLGGSSEWDISSAMGEDFRGGRAVLHYRWQGMTLQPEFVFHIRAYNPSEAAAEAYLQAQPYWFAYCIAKHESGIQNGRTYLQFNELGPLGPNVDDYKYCPNRQTSGGPPWGWGMMQLTQFQTYPGGPSRRPYAQELWNWKENIDTAIVVMEVKEAAAVQHLKDIAPDGQGGYLMPDDITVSGVDFLDGTDKTPDQLETIKKYNAGDFWLNYDPLNGWSYVPLQCHGQSQVKDYTEKVLDQF